MCTVPDLLYSASSENDRRSVHGSMLLNAGAGEGRDHSRGQQAGSRRLGGSIERQRVPPTDSLDALLNRRGKDAFGLEAQNRAPTLPHHGGDYLEFPPRSALDS